MSTPQLTEKKRTALVPVALVSAFAVGVAAWYFETREVPGLASSRTDLPPSAESGVLPPTSAENTSKLGVNDPVRAELAAPPVKAAEKKEPRSAEELHAEMLRLSVVNTDGTLDAAAQRRLAIRQAVELRKLATDFEKRFPKDARGAEVALLRTRLSALPETEGAKARDAAELAADLRQIADRTDAPVRVREQAGRESLVLLAPEVRAGRVMLKDWETAARAHLKNHPENPSENTAVSTLLIEMTQEAADSAAGRSMQTPIPKENRG